MPPKTKGESKRGLVVTLVFFVLATIGLGLSTYYGFAEQEKKDKAVATASEREKLANAKRNSYRVIVAILAAYLDKGPEPNTPTGDEFTPAKKADFDAGRYPENTPPTSTSESLKADMPGLATGQETPGPRRPGTLPNSRSQNYEAVVTALKAEIAQLRNNLKTEEELAEDEKQKRRRREAHDDYRIAKDAAHEKLKNEFKEERDNFVKREQRTPRPAQEDRGQEGRRDHRPAGEGTRRGQEGRGSVREGVVEANAKLVALQAKVDVRTADKPVDPTPRGKILRVHINPRKATIDLGRKDGLTPQTTFAVHGWQSNGKPKVRCKANVEVVTVGEKTSEVLVTGMFHPDPDLTTSHRESRNVIDVVSQDNTDPIMRRQRPDQPAVEPQHQDAHRHRRHPRPARRRHGQHGNLVRMLEKQNIVVDAYVDPLDGTLKGGVTRRTDYILLGSKVTGKEDEERMKKVRQVHR